MMIKTASCNIYFDRHSRTFKMKDFGDESYSGDCFWFVATIKGWNVKSDIFQYSQSYKFRLES